MELQLIINHTRSSEWGLRFEKNLDLESALCCGRVELSIAFRVSAF